MENWEAASISHRANYSAPAKSVPQNPLQTVYLCLILSSLAELISIALSRSVFVSVFCLSVLSVLSLCIIHCPCLWLSVLCLIHRASWRTRGTTPSCRPSRSLAAGSVSAQCLLLMSDVFAESQSCGVEKEFKSISRYFLFFRDYINFKGKATEIDSISLSA